MVIMKSFKMLKEHYERFRKDHKRITKIVAVVMALLVLFQGLRVSASHNEKDVYAASKPVPVEYLQSTAQTGIQGAVAGVYESGRKKDSIERIGTSCEDVIVGQRTKEIEAVGRMDGSIGMEQTRDNLIGRVSANTTQASIMSDNDYYTLLAIVEAEAGGEDLEGRIMVANVILNRVASDRFPNNVYDVVWESVDGMAQFSPTQDGRINTVTISETTVEAVQTAIEGKDLSEGALFFVAKEQANQDCVKWFDSDLRLLFEHGVHTFYTYPDL